MFRDKYKDKAYFEEAYDFNINAFERRESVSYKSRVLPEYMNRYYSSQSLYSRELISISYSLENSPEELLKWFKTSLHYYSLFYSENDGIFTIIDYLSLAVLFDQHKEEFFDDIKVLFDKYQKYSEEDESVQDDYIDFLGVYLLQGDVVNFHSHLEYLNLIGDSADSVIEAQKFWYYAHSEASWYNTHEYEDAYYGYWSFDTAALCKIRGIYDERFKDMDFFPYDLLVQEEK